MEFTAGLMPLETALSQMPCRVLPRLPLLKRCRWFNAFAAFWPPMSSPRLMCRDSITRQWMAMRCD